MGLSSKQKVMRPKARFPPVRPAFCMYVALSLQWAALSAEMQGKKAPDSFFFVFLFFIAPHSHMMPETM